MGKKKESWLTKRIRRFVAKLLKVDVVYATIRQKQIEQDKHIKESMDTMKRMLTVYAAEHKQIKDSVLVGADVHMRGGGWAVVCYRGRNDMGFVQFYQLPDNATAQEICRILRGMQSNDPERITIDASHGIGHPMREMLRNPNYGSPNF